MICRHRTSSIAKGLTKSVKDAKDARVEQLLQEGMRMKELVFGIVYLVVSVCGFCIAYYFINRWLDRWRKERQERERRKNDKEVNELEKKHTMVVTFFERDKIQYFQLLAGSSSVEDYVISAVNFYANIVKFMSEGKKVFIGASPQEALPLSSKDLEKVIRKADG